jgi:cellulose synthase/poly-beta-1,6-N-acetylglucosamine synthase-like glycosyltransferase
MDVETVDEQSLSWGRVALYVGVTALFLTLVIGPVLFSIPYFRALKTVILLILLGQVGRLLVSALMTFSEPENPPELPDDADLPSVSVVIPAYNEAKVLPETIEAIKELDYPAELLEVVLCYEADCHDETGPICERAAAEDPRFKAVKRDEEGGGKAKATNYALRHTTGDVIASIDADHQFESDAVMRAVRWFAAEPDTWCVKGRCFGRNPTDSLIALHATVDRHIVEKADIFARELFSGFTIFGGGQAFFRAEVFEEIGMFDEDILVEDIDMSARLHSAGKRIRVDPEIITYEEQPVTFRAWWSQRKRWARGWMQVSVRYIGRITRSSRPSMTAKADAAQTFAYSLIPAFLIAGMPLPLIDLLHVPATAYIPHSRVIWTIMGIFPAVAAGSVFLQDRRDGLSHHPREYLAALTLAPYMVLTTFVYVVAFIEEFVLKRPSVYVTTASADEADDDAESVGSD